MDKKNTLDSRVSLTIDELDNVESVNRDEESDALSEDSLKQESKMRRWYNENINFWRGLNDYDEGNGEEQENIFELKQRNELPKLYNTETNIPFIKDKFSMPVFIAGNIFVVVFVAIFCAIPEEANQGFVTANQFIGDSLGYIYIIIANISIISMLYLAFSAYGDMKLGEEDDIPEYSFFAWISMLFTCGTGVGIIFYSVAEPVTYLFNPPTPKDLPADWAVGTTMLHWGFHCYAIYGFPALLQAYYCHRFRLPLTFRSIVYPLLGKYTKGWVGAFIDTFALLGTLFGQATGLGIGVISVMSGLYFVFGVEAGKPGDVELWLQSVIIVGTALLAGLSIANGMRKGVRIIASANTIVAFILLVVVGIISGFSDSLDGLTQNVAVYIQILIERSFRTGAHIPSEKAWIGAWTIFYWGWGFSACPYVAVFISRISKGRTIREFVICNLLAPVSCAYLWFNVLGECGIRQDIVAVENGADPFNSPIDTLFELDDQIKIYKMYEQLTSTPDGFWFYVLSVVTMLLLIIFFVSCQDSASLVMDQIACGGNIKTPVYQRLLWLVYTMGITLCLLFSGGSDALSGLQSVVVVLGLPVSILVIISAVSFGKCLRRDYELNYKDRAKKYA